MNYKEDVAPLFHSAIIESGSPTSRAVRPPDAPIHEAQFADFLREAGVPQHLPDDDVFPFLRKQPEEVLAAAQITVWDKYAPSIRWPFQPVVDGNVIPRAPLETWKQGKWHKMPVMTGFTTNEGSLYVPRSMSTPPQFTEFWAQLLMKPPRGKRDRNQTLAICRQLPTIETTDPMNNITPCLIPDRPHQLNLRAPGLVRG
jgi:carboxylesterase type B